MPLFWHECLDLWIRSTCLQNTCSYLSTEPLHWLLDLIYWLQDSCSYKLLGLNIIASLVSALTTFMLFMSSCPYHSIFHILVSFARSPILHVRKFFSHEKFLSLFSFCHRSFLSRLLNCESICRTFRKSGNIYKPEYLSVDNFILDWFFILSLLIIDFIFYC